MTPATSSMDSRTSPNGHHHSVLEKVDHAKYQTPSLGDLDQAADIPVLDSDGKEIAFRSLYWTETGQRRRVLVIFIRHFFCGNCQEYVRSLASQIPPTSLPKDFSIVLVGCGSPTLIASYIAETSCPYPVYAEPSKRLHDILGMHRTLSLGKKDPDYIQHTLISGMVKSIVQGVKRIPEGDAFSGGDLRLIGGEFLFDVEGLDSTATPDLISTTKGNNGLKSVTITWCHRMTNTRDHAEIDELRKVISPLASSEAGSSERDQEDQSAECGARSSKSENPRQSVSDRRHSWVDRKGSKTSLGSGRDRKGSLVTTNP